MCNALLLLAPALLLGACGPGDVEPRDGQRVISLAPSLTEIVYAVGAGDRLVGRTSVCNYPPQVAAQVPVVGGFGVPSLESLLAAKPTLILETDLADEAIGRQIDALGMTRERIKCSAIDDVPPAILRVGALLQAEPAAAALAATLRTQIATLRRRAAAQTHAPTVFTEIWGDPLTTVGRTSFVADLIRLAGGQNIGDEVEKEYFQVSPEWVVARNPDVVICLYMASHTDAKRLVRERSGWANVAAVRNNRVYDGLDNDTLLRPGPRVLDGIEELRRCILHADPTP